MFNSKIRLIKEEGKISYLTLTPRLSVECIESVTFEKVKGVSPKYVGPDYYYIYEYSYVLYNQVRVDF